MIPSVFRHQWLGDRKLIKPVKLVHQSHKIFLCRTLRDPRVFYGKISWLNKTEKMSVRDQKPSFNCHY